MSFAPPPHPYPSDRYEGADGERSATFRPGTAAHDITSPTGWGDYLATGATTRGDFGLYRWHMNAEGSGPRPHLHRSLSESFFVLDGTVNIYDGNRWIPARPGDFVFVPEGGIHGFHNDPGSPATMLILFSPGAPREAYFEGLVELGRLSQSGGPRPSDEEMAEFYRRHDTYWVSE